MCMNRAGQPMIMGATQALLVSLHICIKKMSNFIYYMCVHTLTFRVVRFFLRRLNTGICFPRPLRKMIWKKCVFEEFKHFLIKDFTLKLFRVYTVTWR